MKPVTQNEEDYFHRLNVYFSKDSTALLQKITLL